MKAVAKSRNTIALAGAGLLGLIVLILVSLYLVYPSAFQALGLSVVQPAPAAADYFPTQGWHTSTPEEQGFDSAKVAQGLLGIRKQAIPVHSLTIIRKGRLILDAYFYPYEGTSYHDLASVTKSVMTTLIGIAATQGRLSLDAPMLSFFPNRTIANRDARKERITVRHLAGMSSGLDCTEAGGEKTLQEMNASPDWVQFALDRPMSWEPGTHWVYCGPAIHLLSAVLQQATGMTALQYARENLFKPLGIEQADWPADPQGYTRGWGDLALQPRDAAKLGYLWLNQGSWDGKQIVSRDWVNASVKGYFSGTGRKEEYGYGWWVSPKGEDPAYYLAAGRNGQRIQLLPAMDLMIITTGGGFEFDQIEPFLVPAIVDLTKPLPANPNGVAQLQAALAAVTQGPAGQPLPPLPATARAVSAKTFVFGQNPKQIQSLRVEFSDGPEATVQLKLGNEENPRDMVVGLDGVFRASRGGRPILARGQWADGSTFRLEVNEGPGLTFYMLPLRFEGDKAWIDIAGLPSMEGRRVE